MRCRISKRRVCRSRLSRALPEEQLHAVANTLNCSPRVTRHANSPGAVSPPVGGSLDQDAALVRPAKRQRPLDLTSEIDPLPTKRARLTDTERSGVENDKSEQADEVVLLEPKPSQRLYASFLEEFDPPDSQPSESVDTVVSRWLESVGSDREKLCRSDSYLHRSEDEISSSRLTQSAPPEMGSRRDGVPSTSTPARSRSRATLDFESTAPSDSGRSSSKSLVENTFYQSRNLAVNGIHLREVDEPLPSDVAGLVRDVGKKRNSPGPSPEQVFRDKSLHRLENGAEEPDVEEYFRTNIYPYPKPGEDLKRSDRQPMSRNAVPKTGSGSGLRVSNPIPDMLYGYNDNAFRQQRAQLISMGNEMSANNQGLLYPFFVIEFKGDGPGGAGALWVATNQCLGGSASCVNIAERLNRQLRHSEAKKVSAVDSSVFSIAMNGSEARLFISWKHKDLDYYMQRVDSFLLQKPDQYREFRKYVLNIIDWGKDKRLKEIRNSLDVLLEESRKKASEAAKSRQSPANGSASTSKIKKQKS
ncbi:hypothetical protein F4779DRAFT_593244 [Xylariaceae sp. FL0662B]|nr:hypothetical protein F4779DRAFT_593244 [Xylariaceae sp. FL0662B]